MSDIVPLDELELAGVEEYPVTSSLKIWGPPGTGKTTQSAGRVGKLLSEHGYDGYDVTWVTYRKSLATETIQRLVEWDLIPEVELDDPSQGQTRTMGTIHALGNRIMDTDKSVAGIGARYRWASERGINYGGGGADDNTLGTMFFDVIGWMRNNLLDPSDPTQLDQCPKYGDFVRHHSRHSIPSMYEGWRQFKEQNGLIDFTEMLERPLEEGRHPDTPIVVIDEWHDATPLMAELGEMWVDGAEIAIVAGDPNQVVNHHEGASPKFFRRIDLPTVLLDETWRVPERHWRIAARVLGRSEDVPPVSRKRAGAVKLYDDSPRFDTNSETGHWERPLPNEPNGPAALADEAESSIMFVARTKSQIEGISSALSRAGIPNATQSGVGGWNTDGMRDTARLYNALRGIEDAQTAQFTEGKGYGLGRYVEAKLSPETDVMTVPEADALLYHTDASLIERPRSKVEDLITEWSDEHGEEGSITLDEFAREVELEFWDRYANGPASVDRLLKRNLSDHDRTVLKAALARGDIARIDPGALDVSAMTIHASKGQEAENVVIYDGITKRIREGMETDRETWRNECRTWFVALTRASECLHIHRGGFEWTSPFVGNEVRAALASEQRSRRVKSNVPADD